MRGGDELPLGTTRCRPTARLISDEIVHSIESDLTLQWDVFTVVVQPRQRRMPLQLSHDSPWSAQCT